MSFTRLRLPNVVDVAALLAMIAYAVVAWYLRYRYNWFVRDALSRTANALYAAGSHDPHAGAIGFYWPPLSSAMQIPLIPLLRPWGAAEFAGPLSTAVCGGLCLSVLGRTAREFGMARFPTILLLAGFATNPFFVIFAASGMSEVPTILFMLFALHFYLRYRRDDVPLDLAFAGVSLVGVAMLRTEGILSVLFLGLVEVVRIRSWRRTVAGFLILTGPAAFAFLLWLAAQRILLGDAFFFLHPGTAQQGAGGVVPAAKAVGPAPAFHLLSGDPLLLPPGGIQWAASLRYVAAWTLAFGPAILICIPGAFIGALRAIRRRPATGRIPAASFIAPLALTAAFAAVNVVLTHRGSTFGDPRYFSPVLPCAALALVLVGSSNRRWIRHTMSIVVLPALLVGHITTWVALDDPVHTKLQREQQVLDIARGRHVTITDGTVDTYRQAAKDVDPRLARGEHLLMDYYANTLFLLCDHRKNIIQPSDRDFERTVETPDGMQLIAAIGPVEAAFFGAASDRAGEIVRRDSGWRVWKQYGDIVTIYERDASAPPVRNAQAPTAGIAGAR